MSKKKQVINYHVPDFLKSHCKPLDSIQQLRLVDCRECKSNFISLFSHCASPFYHYRFSLYFPST